MKLKRGIVSEGRRQLMKSVEAVRAAEQGDPALEFDVLKVISPQIWDRIDKILRSDRHDRSSDELPLLRLAVFDLARRLKAEQDDDLPGQVQYSIYNLARHVFDSDIVMNTELAKYVDLFPRVLDGLDDLFSPLHHDFDKSLASFDRFSRIDLDTELLAPRMRGLLQLFPKKRDSIFQKIDQLQFWQKGMKGARELSVVPGEALNHLPAILASLAVIFPERKEDILEVIRPRWNELTRRLTSWGNSLDMELDDPDPDQRPGRQSVTAYVDNIMGMAFLADLSQQKSLVLSRKLPERLVT